MAELARKIFRCGYMRAAALLLLFCGGASADGTFVTAVSRKPETLDPAALSDRYSLMVALNIYEPLVAFGGKSYSDDFVPALSSVVPTKENGFLSADGRTYVFHIMPGIKFHEGGVLSAEDVRYSLLRLVISDALGGPAALYLKPLLGVTSIRDSDGKVTLDFARLENAVRADGGTLTITLKEPYPPFLTLLASRPFVTSKAWAVAHGEWDGTRESWLRYSNRPVTDSYLRSAANGTGPFRLEKFDEQNGTTVLMRNDAYWRKPSFLEKVVFAAIPATASREAMLASGDVDYAEFSRANVPDFSKRLEVTASQDAPVFSLGKFLAFSFKIDTASNTLAGSGRLDGKGIPADFFSDGDIRRGFAHAVDYETILSVALGREARRVSSPAGAARAPGQSPLNFDRETASAYFKKAFGGAVWEKGFVFTAAYKDGDSEAQAALETLALELKNINPRFVMRAKPMSKAEMIANAAAHKLPIAVASYAPDYPDYYELVFNMLHSEGLFPRMQGYANPEMDRLCDKLLYASGEQRREIFAAIDRIYFTDAPQILLFVPDDFRAFRSGISGIAGDEKSAFAMHGFVDYYKVRK